MAPGAGRLDQRVTFEAPVAPASDGGGGVVDGFAPQFTVWAGFFRPRGDEAVTAARLEGRHVVDVTVRSSSQSRQITTDWRMVDARRPADVFNIRFVDTASDPAWVRLTAEKGVAT
ncbi:phage head completion protein [Kumtagia ephedrae]|uniref:Head-tail adaptor protein n=1 Tax=Kumtagia ephedrae TaxID=2116701 RepID=A0A2P7SPR9_9HYPH|nr:head-tail adaptor protein [Mesorhizobium ephedrae]PSJ64504.1 head-tail adaptor protein [Mesorhizobium ephedrae]